MDTKTYLAGFVSILSLCLAVSGAYAAAAGTWSMETGTFMKFDSMDLIGAPVKDSQGELLGLISGLQIDSGGHAFAVINHGSDEYYGEGGGFTPVPFEALRISEPQAGQIQVVLNTDEKGLESAPFFDPEKNNDRQYEAKIYQYYGLQPYWTEGANCIGDWSDIARSKTPSE